MSQFDFGTINPATKDGTTLASDLNAWRTAVHSFHKGSSQPSYRVAGMTWVDDAVTPWVIKMYDGTDWITIGTVNASTNVFNPANSGNLFKKTLITAGGTHTWDAETESAYVEVLAGGGGGGSGTAAAASASAGTGGGAGGYASKFFVKGANGTVVIGAAGTGGTGVGGVGGAGGTSSWSDGVNTISCGGGAGGNSTNAITTLVIAAGGAGGTATGGDVNAPGNPGDPAHAMSVNILVNGVAGLARSGNGAGSPWGGGGMSTGASSSTSGGNTAAGSAATGRGAGGGGGAGVNSATAAGGGVGTAGAVVVWEYK